MNDQELAQREPTLEELLRHKRDLEERIAKVQAEEKATAIASIRALMQSHGVALADLGAAKRRISVGTAKYRDPSTGKTWTGRGRPPAWFLAGRMEQIAA